MSSTMIVTTRAAGAQARKRLLSELARGEAVDAVFFYSDGVDSAGVDDERRAWRALGERHGLPLILCQASAARRGLIGADGSGVPAGFEIGGIGRFAELAAAAERIDVAGRA